MKMLRRKMKRRMELLSQPVITMVTMRSKLTLVLMMILSIQSMVKPLLRLRIILLRIRLKRRLRLKI
jgi:hypothetical protein